MDQLKNLVGAERSLEGVCQTIHLSAVERSPSAVGAMHITCADEAEHECVSAFQRGFVNFMLPPLKFAQQSAFRIANLGGRYDWGAVRIAEQNYAGAAPPNRRKLLVIKVNSHVGVLESQRELTYGVLKRYDKESHCCGAIHGLLSGVKSPYAERMAEVLVSEGPNRIDALLDETRVDPTYRALYAAIVCARVQARKVIMDIQDYRPKSPTEYLVIPCVTINRPEKDTEIVCGFYLAADDESSEEAKYYGLGDDPAAYKHSVQNDRLIVSDEHIGTSRTARNHRQLALEQWHQLMRGKRLQVQDERLDKVRREASSHKGRYDRARKILPVLLTVLAEVEPVSAAILLFANGCGGIHHAFRVHRLARELEGSDQARKILAEVRDKVDDLEPREAEAIMELLTREYRT
jgi:hypothetical protein